MLRTASTADTAATVATPQMVFTRLAISYAATAALGVMIGTLTNFQSATAKSIDLTGRRELFVDDYLIGTLRNARVELQQPTEKSVVLVHDQPWEGNTCTYHTVFRDADKYRMYYRGSHFDTETNQPGHGEVTCYAESDDGIHWVKPTLGIHEFQGSSANNIVIGESRHAHCFAPFRDTNPAAKPSEKYKALTYQPGGLVSYRSADAIHWSQMASQPVITEGRFDSLNVAHWDSHRRQYVEFHRDFRNGVRDIKTSTSSDFCSWTKPQWLRYSGAPSQHLYTNAIVAYQRAPQLFVGLPMRFNPSRNPEGHSSRGVSDCVLMTSRDGLNFHRWNEAFVRPGRQPDRWVNRNNLAACGLVVTKADIENAPDELSFYLTEGYYRGDSVRLRRYTLRLDGFASISAQATGGEMVTRPVLLGSKGQPVELRLNFATSAVGSIRCEILDKDGQVIPGYSVNNCNELYGDHYDKQVTWRGKTDLAELVDKPVKLRFVLFDADLFAIHAPPIPALSNPNQATE